MISAIDRVRIAAAITANPRTVLRVYQGKGSDYSKRRVAEAARTMGLPEPPATAVETPEPKAA